MFYIYKFWETPILVCNKLPNQKFILLINITPFKHEVHEDVASSICDGTQIKSAIKACLK